MYLPYVANYSNYFVTKPKYNREYLVAVHVTKSPRYKLDNMYILYAIMQTQLRKNIDAAHTYTNTAKDREKKEKAKH